VPAMIEQLSGIAPDRSINPDEAVARGAALFASYQMAKQSGQEKFQVTDVCAHSLGIQGIDQGTLQRENITVIPRNSPLPAQVMKPFVTQSDSQRSIVVQVLEGESSQPDMCSRIGRSVLRSLPTDLPKGHQVNITFIYGSNARLTIAAELPGTDHRVTIELEREQGLNSTQLGRWRQLIDQYGGTSVDELLTEALQVAAGDQADAPAAPQPSSISSTPVAVTAAHTVDTGSGKVTATPAQQINQRDPDPPSQSTVRNTSRPVETTDPLDIEKRQRRTRRLIFIFGHVVSTTIGLAAAYYILCWFRPEADFLGLFNR
ncbi:MAG: heat shock 70 family protein, partial [Planctomycetales bacterium]